VDEVQKALDDVNQFDKKAKNGDYSREARLALKYMQKRDYPLLDAQMDCAKDENIKDLSFGRMGLQIPEDHYRVLTLMYPDLVCPDAEIKTKAWKAFCFSDESIPYKPNSKLRSM